MGSEAEVKPERKPKAKSKTALLREARAKRVAERMESKALAMDIRFRAEEAKRAKAQKLASEKADRAYKRAMRKADAELRAQHRALTQNDPRLVFESYKSRHYDAKRRYQMLRAEAQAAAEFNLPGDPDAQAAYQGALALSNQAYKECHILYVQMKYYERKARAWLEGAEERNKAARQKILEQNAQDLTTG